METRSAFVQAILGETGKPYVYGGDTPANGFDCSGLGFWAAGIARIAGIPRTSQQMFQSMVPTDDPQPGDFVFMDNGSGNTQPDHVAYVVDPDRHLMVSANHPGDTVRVQTWDGWNVVGFRALPGAPTGTRMVATTRRTTGIGSARTTGFLPGLDGSLDPLGILPDPSSVLGDVGSVIGDALAELPTAFLSVLLGDHTLVEIWIRTLETLGGAIVLATGAVLLVKVIAAGGEPARAASGAKSAASALGGAYVGGRKAVKARTPGAARTARQSTTRTAPRGTERPARRDRGETARMHDEGRRQAERTGASS